MKLQKNHSEIRTYPAVLTTYPDGDVEVSFPDLHASTQAEGKIPALRRAEELLGLVLYGLEEDQKPIPAASNLASLCLNPGQVSVEVKVSMPDIRRKVVTYPDPEFLPKC